MKSWKRKLRMGMIGGGQGAFIGGVHRYAAALDQQIELVAGCFSRDFENTRETGRQLYIQPERLYSRFTEMAEKEAALPKEERIDFVSIVTPNSTHFPAAKAFLEAGIHVLCDKPVTFDYEQSLELEKLVEKTGLLFGVTHNYTGNPLVRQAKQMVENGELGDIRKVMVEYLQDFLSYPFEKEGNKQAMWRVDPKLAGAGGTLGDCGSHALNLLEYIIGPQVTEICADKSTFMPGRVLDEDVNVLLRLKSGGKGMLTVSQIAIGQENALRIRIYGSKGSLEWDQENPNYLYFYRFGEPRQIYTRSSGYLGNAAAEITRVPSGHPEGYLEAFANIYMDFASAVRAVADGSPAAEIDIKYPTIKDGVRGMEFISKAVESCEKGSVWIEME